MPYQEPPNNKVGHILSSLPPWLIRWGNTGMVVLLGAVLTMCFLIHFRNKTEWPVQMIASHSNQVVILRDQSNLVWFCPDGAHLSEGDTAIILRIPSGKDSIIKAKQSGIVSHCRPLAIGQKTLEEMPLLIISPQKRSFYLLVLLPFKDQQAIRIRDKVQIEFPGHISVSLEGEVSGIYPLPKDNEYNIVLNMHTNIDSIIQARHPLLERLQAKMYVYSKNQSLFEKIVRR
jgi:hypothetical protein